MLSHELNYLVSLEQHQDRLRGLERHQLVQLAGQQRPGNPSKHRGLDRWPIGKMGAGLAGLRASTTATVTGGCKRPSALMKNING